MLDGPTGFWSYVQADDESDHGRVLSLSRQLRAEYQVQTADELSLFVDREALEWGAEWATRIDDAIAGTTFFIPIITPSYFKSQACRDELLRFALDAKRLGLEQLLLPVYWVTVPELEQGAEDSPDEAIRLIARFQREDLRKARLEDEDSAVFRKTVSKLASELARRATTVTETVQDVPDRPAHSIAPAPEGNGDEDQELGVIEKLAASEAAMPQLTEIMEEIGHQIEEVGELVDDAGTRMQAASARGQSMKAHLVITEKLAQELGVPAARIEELGHRYASLLAELDPGIHTLLDMAAESDPAAAEEIEFVQSMQELASSADEALEQLEMMVASTKDAAKFSRSLRAPLNRMRRGLQGVLDGRAIIEEWGRRARGIEDDRGADPPDDHPI